MGLVEDGPLCLLQPAMAGVPLTTTLAEGGVPEGGYRPGPAGETGDSSVCSGGTDDSGGLDPTPRDADKYKTELCRNWMQTGACPYNDRCQFAHGYGDMRVRKQPAAYKTRICRTFSLTNTCPYGTKCRFIHAADPGLQGEAQAGWAADGTSCSDERK